jgi:hypothetical protein
MPGSPLPDRRNAGERSSRVPYERGCAALRRSGVAFAREALAAADLEAAARALEGAVAPLHCRRATRAGLDRTLRRVHGLRCRHAATLRGAADVVSKGGCPNPPRDTHLARAISIRPPALASPAPHRGACAARCCLPRCRRARTSRMRGSLFAYRQEAGAPTGSPRPPLVSCAASERAMPATGASRGAASPMSSPPPATVSRCTTVDPSGGGAGCTPRCRASPASRLDPSGRRTRRHR